MRKINVDDVAAHLAHVLGFSARSISSSPPEPAHGAAHEPDWQR
jgi:hypothetical protein